MDHSEVKHLPKIDHTPAELDAASKFLLAGADYLENHGWRQHNWGCRGDAMCANGALLEGIGVHPGRLEGMRRLIRALGFNDDSWVNVVTWNNSRGRTKEEIVAKLRAVALGL